MSSEKIDQILGILLKVILLFMIGAFAPATINELSWLYKGKKSECLRVQSEYESLVASTSGLNSRVFSPGDGSAINQAFLGTVLASATQSPNSKLIQATIYGCGTSYYTIQQISW